MSWNTIFPKDLEPQFDQVSEYISSPLWNSLNEYLQHSYAIKPKIEHSICSGAPGWNVKYKKSGRSLCVLYPEQGCFTCLVCIGQKEALEAEMLLNTCSEYTQNLYQNAKPLNGSRWLMLRIDSEAVLEDVKKLISTRVTSKK